MSNAIKTKHRKEEIKTAMENVTPRMMLEYFEERIIGQHKELKTIVYMLYSYLKRASEDYITDVPSWILTAPSGCGKTEVYRTLNAFCKEYGINIPIVQIDLSQYTETGFQGKETDFILQTLALQDGDLDGIGVCFLDEADKKLMPSHNSDGENVNAKAQSNLLMLIEGKIEYLPLKNGGARRMDSNQTMFVLMGAFQDLRDDKQKDILSMDKGIGFRYPKVEASLEEVFYEDISLEEMIEFGMLEEVAGRMQMVINLHKLSKEDMTKLILSKINKLEREMQISVVFDDDTIDSLLEICYTNLGVRRVMNCLRTIAYRAVSDVFYDRTIDDNCCLVIESADKAYLEFAEEETLKIHENPA